MEFSESVIRKFAGYYVNHVGFRRDLRRLEGVIKHFSRYAPSDLEALKQWFALHKFMILEHHHAEDDFFFTRIEELLHDDHHGIFEDMRREHHEMDEIIEKIDHAIAHNDVHALRDQLQAYYDLVVAHLDHEEALFIPLVEEKITDEWATNVEKEFLNTLSMDVKLRSLSWGLDESLDDPMVRKYFFAKLPFPAKMMYKLKLKPAHDKLVAAAMRPVREG